MIYSINPTMLQSYPPKETGSSAKGLLILPFVLTVLGGIVGWGVRENCMIEEIKRDPVKWFSRLPLEKQALLKEHLKTFPEGLQTSQPAE